MIKFTNKHNCMFDEGTLSDAVEWYARLKGVTLYNVQRAIWAGHDDYLNVSIGIGGSTRVHRLLMMHHLGRKLSSKEFVHHKDENILNNVLSNLELTTNPEHATLHRGGADIPDSEIIEMLAQGKSQCYVARYFGCTQPAISLRVKKMGERK